ncbi:hypothetical protein Pmani_033582 [Petrolisthes manimaculis]|uniref:RAE1/2 domain-containing protein n=1 Tax=Petrolisthes manimaculis TaxID=1843537 RepID=A0AAE1TQ94_9EUCA|nr:hypothetical protein Pmani_033582 [Petrolisthes manimaculis]
MEEPELDTQYDVIVVGTGLVESVVAAAAARIGKKILHIDRNDYYGGQWASFNFNGIREWISDATDPPPPPPQQQQQFPGADELVLAEGESLVAVGDPSSFYFNVNQTCYMPEVAPAPSGNNDASPQQETAHQSSAPEAEEAQSQTTKETPSPNTSREEDDVGTSEADENESASVASESEVVAEEENAHAGPALPTTTTTEEENAHAGPPLPTTTAEENAHAGPLPTTTAEEENAHAGPPLPTTEKNSEESHKTTEANDSTAGNMITPAAIEESEKVWAHRDFVRHSRKFNIDLAPKLLYSRGPLVELLISSNVARYTEFKCITRVLTWMMTGKGECEDGGLLAVPCSRSDVFTTSAITLVEKRLLMKFLQFCSSYEKHQEQLEEFQERTFGEFLKSRGLTANLIHFVTAAMAMVGPDEPCQTGLERTRLFLASLGRYGSTPFLFSMYGCGELPQAFCRLCAVFEGTYVLRKPVSHLVVDSGNNRCIGLVAEGQRFGCDNLVMSSDLTPSHYHGDNGAWSELCHISRAILFTDRSILPHKEEQLTLLRLPPTPDNPQPVTVIEGGSRAGICPQGVYCLQLSCLGKEAEVDLAGAVRKLVDHPGGPTLLWSLYFNQVDVSRCDLVSCSPANLYLCPGPDSSLDYDAAITQARTIFFSMFPDETFLPRAPDPDEIVFDNIGAELKDGDYFEEEGSSKTEQENKLEGQETGREEAVSEGHDSEDNNAQVNETKEEVTSKGI